MLRTVVLPAPFGPIRLVTLPGSASSETSFAAFTPPKAMRRRSASSTALPGAPRCTSPALPRRGFRRRAAKSSNTPTPPSGASQSTTRSKAPKKRSRYSASPARNSGSSTTIADERAGERARAADDHDQHEEDRLREREGRRRDEAGQRREEGTRHAGAERGDGERHRLDAHRVEADRFGGHLGVLHRAHGGAPAASRNPVIAIGRQRGQHDRGNGD